jgi:murein DD-endopeptidase MepM/ murein hydrolase activator NlpD
VLHAACDLIALADTPVYAIFDGTVWYTPGVFFVSKTPKHTDFCPGRKVEQRIVTFEMAIVTAFGIFRYGEISQKVPRGVTVRGDVSAGQVIGWVAHQHGGTMLHLEMFRDASRKDALTKMGNKNYLYIPDGNYNRRSDLDDPTDLLGLLPLKTSASP